MLKKLWNIVKFLAFAACLWAMLLVINGIFQYKTHNYVSGHYFQQKEDTFDVVFLGPSTTLYGVYPMELWNDFGIMSYNLATPGQPVLGSYYLIKEIIAHDHPALIVLDAGRVSTRTVNAQLNYLHDMTDNMPLLSENRLAIINSLAREEDRLELYVPLELYHNRWDSLTEDDWKPYYKRITYGAGVIGYQSGEIAQYEDHAVDSTAGITHTREDELRMIIDLCKEEDVELLLVRLPICGVYQGISQYNYDMRRNADARVADIARRAGVPFLNLFDEPEEVGLVTSTDSMDGQHLSILGAQKFTRYIGEYLKEHYDLPDLRNDASYDYMDKLYEEYIAYKWPAALTTSNIMTGFFEFLKQAEEDTDYLVVLAVNGDIDGISVAQTSSIMGYGVKMDLTHMSRQAYIAVLDDGKLIYETSPSDYALSDRFEGEVDGISVDVRSSVLASEENAQIRIAGAEYAKNQKGLNVAVYNKATGKLVDSRVYTLDRNEGGTVEENEEATASSSSDASSSSGASTVSGASQVSEAPEAEALEAEGSTGEAG